MADKFRVAHFFAPAMGRQLSEHPLIGSVRELDRAAGWDLPLDVDVIFAPPDFTDISEDRAPRPPGWPGSVKLVQIASSGTDGYPKWLFDAPIVATSAGTSAPAIAEYVLAAMLMHEKRLPGMFVTGGTWPSQQGLLDRPLGNLDGRTLGLLGVGHIARRVARLASAFGMTVVAHRRSDAPSPDAAIALVSFDDLLARADHLVVAAPLYPATTGLLGAAALAKTRRGVHLINVARGAIVDSVALAAALATGQVGAATLDVTDPEPLPAGHPLWRAPNVRITPHVAWSSADTPRRIFALFAENLGRLARGERLVNQLG